MKINCKINYEKVNFSRDFDVYPSPYLTGEFDYLFKIRKSFLSSYS